jgi:hypothetical protein
LPLCDSIAWRRAYNRAKRVGNSQSVGIVVKEKIGGFGESVGDEKRPT